MDLSDGNGRRALFADLNRRANKVLVLTEGLLIYLSAMKSPLSRRTLPWARIFSVGSSIFTRQDFCGSCSAQRENNSAKLARLSSSLRLRGRQFFTAHGWEPIDVKGLLKTATRFKRPPFYLDCWPIAGRKKGPQETGRGRAFALQETLTGADAEAQ